MVVVSCVSSEAPYKPHPHNLVGKEGCSKGVCTIEMDSETMSCTFPSLGIQCVKKKEIEESLSLRQQIRVDPFQCNYIMIILIIIIITVTIIISDSNLLRVPNFNYTKLFSI